MKILVTNYNIERRGGAQVFVRDLARGFQSRGHKVMVFSSDLREIRRLMEMDTIPVTTDIEKLEFVPDIIHGQHHLDTMVALSSLPGTPAVYHAHGAMQRHAVPLHPRIYRYFAMSHTLADRIQIETNLPAERIDVVLNGVDLKRFRHVREAPDKPVRALIYNRIVGEHGKIHGEIQSACNAHGIELDIISYSVGKFIDKPEEVLPRYDLVFASGMSAIDAMACGCAVIILGRSSCGPLVTPENFDALRHVNFSIPMNSPDPSRDKIAAEIARHTRMGCRQVTTRLREQADFEPIVERLLHLYSCVIEEHRAHRARADFDYCGDVLALARYLRTIAPLIKQLDRNFARESALPPSMECALADLQSQLARFQRELQTHRPQDRKPRPE